MDALKVLGRIAVEFTLEILAFAVAIAVVGLVLLLVTG